MSRPMSTNLSADAQAARTYLDAPARADSNTTTTVELRELPSLQSEKGGTQDERADDSSDEKRSLSRSLSAGAKEASPQPGGARPQVHIEEGGQEYPETIADLGVTDPWPDIPGVVREDYPFTLRSVLAGCLCGGLISASNIYIGLRSGGSNNGQPFSALAGFMVLSIWSRIFPTVAATQSENVHTFGGKLRRFLTLGGPFGPKETTVAMAAGHAAGSLGILFTGLIPAMYSLKLLGASPKEDVGRLLTLTLGCAYWGLFFSIPLRKFYIVKQKLTFPTNVAIAYTIRSFHSGVSGARNAKRQMRTLVLAFSAAFIWRVVSSYAPGLLFDNHIFWAFYKAGGRGAINAENWAWWIEWSPAFLGAGMLIGINGTSSLFGGSFAAWGLIGPAIVSTGAAVGKAINPTLYPGYRSYTGFTSADPVHAPTPRYWMLWPGTLMIIVGSLTEVLLNSRTLGAALLDWGKSLIPNRSGEEKEEAIYDPAPPEERVPFFAWGGGMFISGIVSCAVLAAQFNQGVGVSLLSILLGFIFSFMSAEGLGRVSINPTGTEANLSQLIFSAVSHTSHMPVAEAESVNLTAAIVATAAGEQAGDMLQDLKVGHLLRVAPRALFYAQLCGACVSVFLSVGLFLAFATAYPCILTASTTTCSFPVPSSATYRVVAVALNGESFPVPLSAGIFAVVISVFVCAMTIIKHFWIPKRYHAYLPNWVAWGLGFIIPGGYIGLTYWFGSLAGLAWRRLGPASAAVLLYPVAAGMVTGEGMGGVFNAILTIAGVGGDKYGTALGCPMGSYCG